jgi:hypothetical protein
LLGLYIATVLFALDALCRYLLGRYLQSASSAKSTVAMYRPSKNPPMPSLRCRRRNDTYYSSRWSEKGFACARWRKNFFCGILMTASVDYVQAQQESTDAVIKMPQKKFFRQRAHANPFSDHRLEYILLQPVVREGIRMRALAEEFLLRHLNDGIGGFLQSASSAKSTVAMYRPSKNPPMPSLRCRRRNSSASARMRIPCSRSDWELSPVKFGNPA